jgi:hypothetical protein
VAVRGWIGGLKLVTQDNGDFGELQDLVLAAALGPRLLPGQSSPISFPDLAYVTEADEKLLLSGGYAGHTEYALVVSQDEVEQRCSAGQVGFLRFEPPLQEHGNITLRLRVFLGFPGVEPLPLGELVVTFTRAGGRWTTVFPTHAVAF